jgi:glycosyltransferase involved in cell wall biosynthesis
VKILFLVPYPLHRAPSQRFRFEQYFSALHSKGATTRVESFLNSHNWQNFFKKGNSFAKAVDLLIGFIKRIKVISTCSSYDFIFIHREVAPVGPPVFEFVLSKLLRKKIIYDFDDAIWNTDRTTESTFFRIVKWRSKVASICQWSYKVSAGNQYLANYASHYNQRVVVNPTTIDTHYHRSGSSSKKSNRLVTIGWTGSHSTVKYLTTIEAVLKRIENDFPDVRFIVIADKEPTLALTRLTFMPWDFDSEIKDLQLFDIGIMPLPNDEWSRGKCGFKLIQYLSLGLPAVASDVGVNGAIIQHGETGYLCRTDQEWYNALKVLIEEPTRRERFGESGKKFIDLNYSVESNTSNFLSLFE